MRLYELFLSFFQIGLFTFGGGYAMLPMLQKELVEKKGWISEEELLNYFAIGQCTPGIIAVNTATFVGTKKRGVIGGIVSTLGVILPSFIIITLLASLISLYKDNIYLIKAFSGIRIAVCALIGSSIIKLCKKSLTDWLCILLAVMALFLQLVLHVNSIFITIGTVVFGIIYYLLFGGKI